MKGTVYRRMEELRNLVKQADLQLAQPAEKPAASKVHLPNNLSEEELFDYSMRDVVPLGWSAVPLPYYQPVEVKNPRQSEDEGLRLLIEFVTGKGNVDLRLSGEYIEGSPHPGGHRLLEDLRVGTFSVQSHIDLHGLTLNEARICLEEFIRRSLHRGHGCVRIVHGRGHHSSEGKALLKQHVQKWLNSRRLGRHVIAYTSARLCDGGGGAVYVLLRRRG
jgi:DNA-nicking Smr family endonuclease